MIGGVHKVGLFCGFNSDAILLYKPTDDSWVVTEGALKTAKRYVTAINVRRNIFPEC